MIQRLVQWCQLRKPRLKPSSSRPRYAANKLNTQLTLQRDHSSHCVSSSSYSWQWRGLQGHSASEEGLDHWYKRPHSFSPLSHLWVFGPIINGVLCLQGAPGPSGLKGNSGEMGPAVSLAHHHITWYWFGFPSGLSSTYTWQNWPGFVLNSVQGPPGLPGIPGQNGRAGKRVQASKYDLKVNMLVETELNLSLCVI